MDLFIYERRMEQRKKTKNLHETIVREPAANPIMTRKSNISTNPSETETSTRKTEATPEEQQHRTRSPNWVLIHQTLGVDPPKPGVDPPKPGVDPPKPGADPPKPGC